VAEAELPSIDSPNNPNFLGMKKTLGLEFKPHTSFAKKDIDERQALIQSICEMIWAPRS
jgi:hypothetical protein